MIQPKVLNEYLKTGLGRNIPACRRSSRTTRGGSPDPHREAYVQQGLLGPTVPKFWVYNPAYAQVQNEHVWQTAWADIMKDGMTPQAAAEKAFKRVEEIFAKYPIAQAERGGTQQVLAAGPIALDRPRRPPWRRRLHGSDFAWAIAFVVPYVAVFFAFAAYPIGYALWMAGKPSLYAELIDDPIYLPTVVNTLFFVGLGVNLKMFLALLLSGFFMRRRWWIRALLVIYILPWALPAVQTVHLVPLDADRRAGFDRPRIV